MIPMRKTVAGRTDGKISKVYEYGVPHGTNLGEPAERQFQLANEFNRALYETWKNAQDARDVLFRESPETCDAYRSAESARTRVEQALADLREARSRNRSTIPDPKCLDEYNSAKEVSQAASKAFKVSRREAEKSSPELAKILKNIEAERRSNIKATRQAFAKAGLYWGTYNRVAEAHASSVSTVIQRRSKGLPADVRRNPIRALGCQIQRQADKPVRSPELLGTENSPWAGQVVLVPPDGGMHVITTKNGKEVKRRNLGRLRMRVSSTEYLDIPVIMHRPLPEDADITNIKVKREREGHWQPTAPRWKITVHVTFYTKEPPHKDIAERAVNVDAGWANLAEGQYLLAKIFSEPPLPAPPDHLTHSGSVTWQPQDGGFHQVLFPLGTQFTLGRKSARGMLAPYWRHPNGIRSTRDDDLDKVKKLITDELRVNQELVTKLEISADEVVSWRSPARFAKLVLRWPDNHHLQNQLEAWRQRDAHLWEYEWHERHQMIAARRNFYREVAAWITRSVSNLVINDIPLAKIKRVPGANNEDHQRDRASRHNMQMIALYELIAALEQAARHNGVRRVVRYSKAQ